MKKAATAFMAALLLAGVAAQGQDSPASIYKTNCASCHGANGDANTPAGKKYKATAFTNATSLKKPDSELLVIARNGKGQMPPWGDVLSDADILRVISYIRTFQKKG